MKFSHMINNYTSLNITKLDVLDAFKTIKVGMHYEIDGKKIDYMPSTLKELGKVKVHTEELPGWEEDITKVTTWEDLPTNAKNYV